MVGIANCRIGFDYATRGCFSAALRRMRKQTF
jgi:hypothetical protein